MAIPLSYNFRNLFVRKTTTIMTALGIALSVAVLVGISALVGGLNGALAVTGDPLHVIVMRQGSTAELNSTVTREQFQNLKFIAGIAEDNGEPMASLEVLTVFNLPFRSNPDEVANVNVRGLPPMGIRLPRNGRNPADLTGPLVRPGQARSGGRPRHLRDERRNLDRRQAQLRPR